MQRFVLSLEGEAESRKKKIPSTGSVIHLQGLEFINITQESHQRQIEASTVWMSRALKEFIEKIHPRNQIIANYRAEGPIHKPRWECRVDANGLTEITEGYDTRHLAKEAACELLLKRLKEAQKPRTVLNAASPPYIPSQQPATNSPRRRLLIVRTDLPHPSAFGAFADVEAIYFFGPSIPHQNFPVGLGEHILQQQCIVGQNDPNVTTAAIQLFIGLNHRDFTEIYVAVKRDDTVCEAAWRPTIQAAACFGIRVNYCLYI